LSPTNAPSPQPTSRPSNSPTTLAPTQEPSAISVLEVIASGDTIVVAGRNVQENFGNSTHLRIGL